MRLLFILLLTFPIVSGCNDDENTELCFSFDERSCQTDLWMEGVDIPTNINDRLSLLEGYLNSQGVNIRSISVDSTFHEVVCLACDVCPSGPRFYVDASGSTEEDLSDFRLLNLEITNCD